MANIFSRGYKDTNFDDELISKVMYCPDCGCPLILKNGNLEITEEDSDSDESENYSKTYVEYTELNKDLFDFPAYYFLSYGVPADLSLGSETARRLNLYYHFVESISNNFEMRKAGETYLYHNLFILLISNRKFAPITMDTLESCIKELALYCINEEIHYLAMPRIGSGKGKLDWEDVRSMIIRTFNETIKESIKNCNCDEDYKINITFCYQ